MDTNIPEAVDFREDWEKDVEGRGEYLYLISKYVLIFSLVYGWFNKKAVLFFSSLVIVPAYWIFVRTLVRSAPYGKGQTRKSRILRMLSKIFVSPTINGCGCFGEVEQSTVESQEYALQKESGARLKFRKVSRNLERCHQCGDHFTVFHEGKKLGECWPEEILEKQEEMELPILRSIPEDEKQENPHYR